MRAVVNLFAFCLIVFAFLGARGPVSADERPSQDGADLFVPSLHVISGVTVQEWDGTVSSEICRGCTFPNAGAEPLREAVDGNDRDVTPYVGGGLELMTPALLPGGLRLFVGGEFAAAFGTDRNVAREGDPGFIANPAPAGASSQPFGEDVATGQGSLTTATMDHFTYGAHAGIAIPIEVFGRRIRLKPAVAWMQYEIDVEGQVADAECFQPFFGASRCNPLSMSTPDGFLRAIPMRAETTETFDGIGGALDIEMDTGRYGPIGSSLFVGLRAYNILGNRDVVLSSPVVSFSDPVGNDQTRARFTFEVDPWIYRVGVGMRFHWLGYDK